MPTVKKVKGSMQKELVDIIEGKLDEIYGDNDWWHYDAEDIAKEIIKYWKKQMKPITDIFYPFTGTSGNIYILSTNEYEKIREFLGEVKEVLGG